MSCICEFIDSPSRASEEIKVPAQSEVDAETEAETETKTENEESKESDECKENDESEEQEMVSLENDESQEISSENFSVLCEELKGLQRTLFDTFMAIENEEAAINCSLRRKNILEGQLLAKQQEKASLLEEVRMQRDYCRKERAKLEEEFKNREVILENHDKQTKQLGIMKEEHVKQLEVASEKLGILQQKCATLQRSWQKMSLEAAEPSKSLE